MRRNRAVHGALLVGVVTLSLAVEPTSVSAKPISESKGFRKAVTVEGIREHQLALQEIADANGGNRAVGTPGYDASVEYIVDRAEAAGYDVTLDEFTYVEAFSEGSRSRARGDRAGTADVRGRVPAGVRRRLRVVHRKR